MLPIGEDEVHVRHIPLTRESGALRAALEVLTPDEKDRADRFHFPEHRERWILSRGGLRRVLSGYTARPAGELRFVYSEYGKPAFDDGGPVRFNLSHSGEHAMVAVCLGREVGIDIERARLPGSAETLVRDIFSEREQKEFAQFAEEDKQGAFFRGWTRKEAYIKGRGLGLSMPLDSFDVSLAVSAPVLLLAERNPGNPKGWVLADLRAPAGYAAALAVEGSRAPRVIYADFDLRTAAQRRR